MAGRVLQLLVNTDLSLVNTDPTLIGHRCGHCIHFAPTFKSLALDVHSWRGVMAVAAIDCAMEANMPTCREYEVMGYPTIKFFSPNTPAGDMGHERQNRSVGSSCSFKCIMFLKG